MKKQKKNRKIFRLYALMAVATISMASVGVQTYRLNKAEKQIAELEVKRSEAQKMFSELNNVYFKHDDGSYSLTTDVVRVRLWTNEEGIYDLKVTEQGGYVREMNNEKVIASK